MKIIIFAISIFSLFLSPTYAADAGADQIVNSNNLVQLQGENSTPQYGGEIVKYKWKQLEKQGKPIITLSDRKVANPTFISPLVEQPLTLIFQLKTEEYYDCRSHKKNNKHNKHSNCRKYKSVDEVTIQVNPDIENPENSITGIVTDINGVVISGALVQAAGENILTDSEGKYTFNNIPPNERIVINVSHPDYLKNTKILEVSSNQTITKNIKLDSPEVTASFIASAGATLNEPEGSTVELQADGFIDVNGAEYHDEVIANANYTSITSTTGKELISGSFEGSDGINTFPIQSYGFMTVELTDLNGNPLNISANTPATLTFPADPALDTPDTLPLWYFDTLSGYWVQEGEAAYNASINSYVGDVSHFSIWTLALNLITTSASISGCVVDENNQPVEQALVTLQTTNWQVLTFSTEAGLFQFNQLPENDNFQLNAGFYQPDGTFTFGEFLTPIDLIANQTLNLSDCIVLQQQVDTTRSIALNGNLIDDFTADPILTGSYQIWDINNNLLAEGAANIDGSFNISFTGEDNAVYTVHFYDDSGKNAYITITVDPDVNTYDLGTVSMVFHK